REAYSSVQRGVNYLTDDQEEDGSWMHHPAVTALCAIALHNSGTMENKEVREAAVEKARKFILKFVQKDGSIWMAGQEREYPNYTTACALCALAVINNQADIKVMRAARKYLLGSQVTDPKSKSFGGIGYGKSGPGHPDLSNTQWALEALYLTDYLDREPNAKSPKDAKKSDLAWKNAVKFLSSLQNVPESNDAVWVVKDKKDPNYGSFIYKSNDSKAGYDPKNKQTLRGYGSMTYAGLKSMIYARLTKDDPRVKAAVDWGSKHYTLSENPGMGPQGWYYYIQAFAKAYAVLGGEFVMTPDGKKHFWRIDLLKEMLKLQKGKGEWYNEKHGRWWESVPQLVTAYALMSMEAALGSKIDRSE
ncbi:MAG: terpene cyclase/mutase family protein, partial [Victivallales bacterium]|nr:terpene cyclase/mutase family protein [Victivallales bacterium]